MCMRFQPDKSILHRGHIKELDVAVERLLIKAASAKSNPTSVSVSIHQSLTHLSSQKCHLVSREEGVWGGWWNGLCTRQSEVQIGLLGRS